MHGAQCVSVIVRHDEFSDVCSRNDDSDDDAAGVCDDQRHRRVWKYVARIIAAFSPAQRYASAATSHGPVSVCLSVTSRSSVEMAERIELGFGMGASFHLSYTV